MRRYLGSPIFIVIILLLASNMISGRYSSIGDWLMSMVLMIPGIIIAISFHEYGHAFVADKCGDPTPRNQGRLTVNPAAHIDLIGLICLFFVGFGWGRPVEINPRNFKNPRRDEFLVSIAGVCMNFVMAVVFAGILAALYRFAPYFLFGKLGGIVMEIFMYCIQINLVLLVFNLIPIPPLDGFGIITQIFDLRNTKLYWTVYNNGFYILVLLMLFNVTDLILSPLVNGLYAFVMGIFF